MEFIKKYLNLKKLNRREKYIIYGAGGLIGLLIIVQFVITPFFENKNQMKRSLQTKASELAGVTVQHRQKGQRFYALFVFESAGRSGRHQGPHQLYAADNHGPEKQQL